MDFDNHFGAIKRTFKREGREEELESMVSSMLGNKMTVQEISKMCNLPLNTVKAIASRSNF